MNGSWNYAGYFIAYGNATGMYSSGSTLGAHIVGGCDGCNSSDEAMAAATIGAVIDGGDEADALATYKRGSSIHTGAEYRLVETSEGKELLPTLHTVQEEVVWHGKARLVDGELDIEFPAGARELLSPDVPVEVLVTPVGAPALVFVSEVWIDGFTVERVPLPGVAGAEGEVELNWMAFARLRGAETRRRLSPAEEATIEGALAHLPEAPDPEVER